MSPPAFPLGFASGGVDGSSHPFLLDGQTVARASNVRLERRMARTAHGWECVPVVGEDGDLMRWRPGNTQGAWYFNPSAGQSAIRFTEASARIIHSVAGVLFSLRPVIEDRRLKFRLNDVSGGLRSPASVQLAWGEAAEYYFVRTDGVGLTLILDGLNGVTTWSAGYNILDKEASSLPHFAGPVRYLHGRLHIGVRMNNMNAIIVGDPVNRTNYTNASNVLATTEQVYLNTGLFLAPPSGMGPAISLSILPLQDESHGHGEMIAFCPTPGGTWSANTNIWPREAWSTTVISKHAILNSAACGPFGSCHWDGDVAFRSVKGIQSLRSARAERGTPGSPYHNLANPVRYLMDGDFDELLRFSSMARHEKKQRIFCTVRNFTMGVHRWHKGFVTACQDPEQGVSTAGNDLGAWEGLRCLPPEAGGIVQFVSGYFSGREEMFAVCWHQGKRQHSIWRYRPDIEHDILEDGSRSPIESRIITRQMGDSMVHEAEGSWLHLLAEDIVGDFTWEVLWRHTGMAWARVGARHECCDEGSREDGLRSVGGFPKTKKSRRVEFLIRWRGAASVMLTYGPKTASDIGESTNVKDCQQCLFDPANNDYEYSDGSDWAETIIKACS